MSLYGPTIRQLREPNGVGQVEAANLLGLSQPHLSRVERQQAALPIIDRNRWAMFGGRVAQGHPAPGERTVIFILATPVADGALIPIVDETRGLGVFTDGEAAQRTAHALEALGFPSVGVIPCWSEFAVARAETTYPVDETDGGDQSLIASRARCAEYAASAWRWLLTSMRTLDTAKTTTTHP